MTNYIKTTFEKLFATDDEFEYAELVRGIPNAQFQSGNQVNSRGLGKDHDPVALLTEYFTNSFDEYETDQGEVTMRFDGFPAKGRGPNHTHVVISDSARGMTETELTEYFLKFGGTDKDGDPDTTGELGVGSLSALSYTDGIGMVIATSDPNSNQWFGTVVRSNDNNDVEYLTRDGNVFAFDSPLDIGEEAEKKTDGTVIKLFDYEFHSTPSSESIVRRRFGKEMPNPRNTLNIIDNRGSGSAKTYNISGCVNLIENNRDEFEYVTQFSTDFSFGSGRVTVALAPEEGFPSELEKLFYKGMNSRQFLVALDGQTHAHKTPNNFDFEEIGDRVFAIIELESIKSGLNLQDVFKSTRDEFINKDYYKEALAVVDSEPKLQDIDIQTTEQQTDELTVSHPTTVSETTQKQKTNASTVGVNSSFDSTSSVDTSPTPTAEVEIFGTTVKTCQLGEGCTIDVYIDGVAGECRKSDLEDITQNTELKGEVQTQFMKDRIQLQVTAPSKIDPTDMVDTVEMTVFDTQVSVDITYTHNSAFEFDVSEKYVNHTKAITEVTSVPTDPLRVLRNTSNKLAQLKVIEEEFGVADLTDGQNLSERGKEVVEFICTDYTPLVTQNRDTKRYTHFLTLASDPDSWHCASCELPGSQPAKTSENFRKLGFEELSGTGSDDEYCQMLNCENCGSMNSHRCLAAPFPTSETRLRENMPDSFMKRAKNILAEQQGIEDHSSYELDHKRPHMRRENDEVIDFNSITDTEIRERFQLLKPDVNKVKREKCNSCVKSGERPGLDLGNGTEIQKFTKGCSEYTEEVGCEGCPYYDLTEWGEQLEK